MTVKRKRAHKLFDLLQKEGRVSQKRLKNAVIEDNRR